MSHQEDKREPCAECGAPAGMPPAGPCTAHPVTRAEREVIQGAGGGQLDMNQLGWVRRGFVIARSFFQAIAQRREEELRRERDSARLCNDEALAQCDALAKAATRFRDWCKYQPILAWEGGSSEWQAFCSALAELDSQAS